MNNLAKRSLTGAGFVILMLGAAILGQLAFSILMLAVVFLALKEFHALISLKYRSTSRVLIILAGLLFYISLALNAAGWIGTEILLLDLPVLFLVFIAEHQYWFKHIRDFLYRFATGIEFEFF
jgi:phosphatidate cytidylyltransferase